MINESLRITLTSSYETAAPAVKPLPLSALLRHQAGGLRSYAQHLRVLGVSMALVILPVFVQAPLVRLLPWVSLVLTLAWLGLGAYLVRRPRWAIWGDLLTGFAWIWLTGSLYWGWFRAEPVVHLPIEALGLPIALVYLCRGQGRIGSFFFLGSLLGTAVTDLYINWMGLFPSWRHIMEVDPTQVPAVLHGTALSLQTDVAAGRAVVIVTLLLVGALVSLMTSRQLAWWSFGGALLSTVVVDGLFLLTAMVA